MLDAVRGIFTESVSLFLRMSPYLLFGFLFAGLLHVFISLDAVARHLGKSNLASIAKSVVLGIPLPLCSCGVIPAAILLKKKGASRGSVISFLISTPITGVDSIFATYALLGPLFAIYRVVSSALTALVAGVLANFLTAPEHPETGHSEHEHGHMHGHGEEMEEKPRRRFVELFRYAFGELLGDIWKWLILGVLLGGIIAYLIPDTLIQKYLGSGWQAMLVMLIIGIPMYVCATGSIPIAAALMLKGMSPGAALVFLLAGPATNAVTITVVSRELGKRATILYVLSIAVMSVLVGMGLNILWGRLGGLVPEALTPMQMIPPWAEIASAIVLFLLIFRSFVAEMIMRTKGKACH
jgi:uncharacterized membrane protein YraQ (UPF0718 family)